MMTKGALHKLQPTFISQPIASFRLKTKAFLKSEEVGFEPTKRFHVYTLSKRAPSATRTLLQKIEKVQG